MARFTELGVSFVLLLLLCPWTVAATADFEELTLGTEWGTTPGNSPGDLVLTEDGIEMTVENFTSGAFTGFISAIITGQPGPPASFFPPSVNSTQALTLSNINGRFDFTNLPYDVLRVSIEYADAGGTSNLDVNGLGKQEVNDMTSLTSYPDFQVNVTSSTVNAIQVGTIEVVAVGVTPIEWLEIGGQETSFDNLRAVPEPSSVMLAVVALAITMSRRRSL